MEQEQVQGGDPLKDALDKLRSGGTDPLTEAVNRIRGGKSADEVDRTPPPFPQAPSAPTASPSTSVAGSSPAVSGAGLPEPPSDLIGASRITQQPDVASVATDQTNTMLTPGEQRYKSQFGGMDLASVKKFKEQQIPQKLSLLQQQKAGFDADRKALESEMGTLEARAAQVQQTQDPVAMAEYNADVERYNQMAADLNKQSVAMQDLAKSVEADYQMADLREYNIKSQQGGFLGASHNSIVKGVLSMASVVPDIGIDLIAGLTPESLLPSIGGAGKTRDQLAKEWKREIIPAFKEAGMDIWRSGTTEEYEAEMNKGILGRSWLGLMQSAPAMATPMMSGIFLQVYDGAKEEMRGTEWDGIPEGEKNAMAALLALPATALERMGFSNLAANNPFVKQVMARALANLPKNATKEQIEAVVNAETTDAVMNYGIRAAGATIAEAETGGMQYVTDVAMRDIFNRFMGEDGKFELPSGWGEFAKETAMSMAEEGIGGFIMGQAPALAAARRSKKNVGEATTDQQFELLEETLNNPEYLPIMQEQLKRQVEASKISEAQAAETISAWKEAQQIVAKIPEDLQTEKKREAFDLLSQKAKLSKMDKALVGDKVAAIDAKLMRLAGVEPETNAEGEAKPKPTATQEEIRAAITPPTSEVGTEQTDAGEGAATPAAHKKPTNDEAKADANDRDAMFHHGFTTSSAITKWRNPDFEGRWGSEDQARKELEEDIKFLSERIDFYIEKAPQMGAKKIEERAWSDLRKHRAGQLGKLESDPTAVPLLTMVGINHLDKVALLVQDRIDGITDKSYQDYASFEARKKRQAEAGVPSEAGPKGDGVTAQVTPQVTQADIDAATGATEVVAEPEPVVVKSSEDLQQEPVAQDVPEPVIEEVQVEEQPTEVLPDISVDASSEPVVSEAVEPVVAEVITEPAPAEPVIEGVATEPVAEVVEATEVAPEEIQPEPKPVAKKSRKPRGFKVRRDKVDAPVYEATDVVAPGFKRGTQKAVIIPGFEEYQLGVAKTEGGYKVYELSTQSDLGGKPQGNAALAVGDAMERLNRNGKEKLDTVLEKVRAERQSLSDSIRALKIDTKGKAFDATAAIPIAIVNGTLEFIATSIEAGVAVGQAISNAHAAMKKMDWYKNLSMSDKQKANAEFRNSIASPLKAMGTDPDKKKGKTSTQKKIDKTTGVTVKDKKIEVNERTALRDQIRMAARTARGVVSDIRGKRQEFAKAVGDAMKPLRSKVSPAQVRSISTRAAKTDPSNSEAVAKFLLYADRVIEKANYAQDLDDARKAKKKAAKAAKNPKIPINHRLALKGASDVDVSLIEDPREYADAVNTYLNGIVSVSASRYSPAISENLQKLVDKLYKEEESVYETLLKDEFAVDPLEGVTAKELYDAITAEDIDEYMKNFDAEKRRVLSDKILKMAGYRKIAIESYDNQDITQEQKNIVRQLGMAEVDKMTTDQQANYIRTVDNVVLNDAFYGSVLAAAQAENSRSIIDAAEIAIKRPVRRIFSRRVGSEFMSTSDVFRFFFSMKGDIGVIQNRMGVGDFIRGKKKWSDATKKIEKEMAKFYRGLKAKYSNAYQEGPMMAEGLAAWAIQTMPGYDAKQSLQIQKDMILDDITKRANGRGDVKRHGEMAAIVYDQILKDATTQEEVLAKLKSVYPSAYESVMFLIDLSKPYRDTIKENAEDTWNEPGTFDDPYYIHRKTKMADGGEVDLDPKKITRPSQGATTLKPKQAKGTLARQSYRKLANDRIIDYNVRYNSFMNLSNSLYDAYTAKAQMRVQEFMKMPDARIVFGSNENRVFVKDMLANYFGEQYRDLGVSSQVLNQLANGLRAYAVPRALGGYKQIVKQLPEAVAQATMVLKGRVDRIFVAMLNIDRAAGLLNKYAIGDRAGIQGGSKWEGKVKQGMSDFEAAIANGRLDKLQAAYQKASEGLMYSLSIGDSLAAKGSWLALYEQERKRQGHTVTSWEQEARMHDSDQQRQDAALYAESMIDQIMTSSDPAKAAKLSKKGSGGWENMGKAVALSFASYAIQSTSRKALDVSEIVAYMRLKAAGDARADELAPAAAARSLLATAVGTATFLLSSIYVGGFLDEALSSVFDSWDDEDEDTQFAIVAAIIHGMYLMGVMDVDVFRASQAAERNRDARDVSGETKEEQKQTKEQKASVLRMKSFYSRLLVDLTSMGAQQWLSEGTVDVLNFVQYRTLVRNNDESIMTRKGRPMAFSTWLKNPEGPYFYRYNQGWDAKETSRGLIDVVLGASKDANKRLQRILGEDELAPVVYSGREPKRPE